MPSACYTKEDATGAAHQGDSGISDSLGRKISLRPLVVIENVFHSEASSKHRNSYSQAHHSENISHKSQKCSSFSMFSMFSTFSNPFFVGNPGFPRREQSTTEAAKLPSAVFTCGASKRRSELLPREEALMLIMDVGSLRR